MTEKKPAKKTARKPKPGPERKPRRREPVENVVVDPLNPPAVGGGLKERPPYSAWRISGPLGVSYTLPGDG